MSEQNNNNKKGGRCISLTVHTKIFHFNACFAYLVILLICNMAYVKADAETFDDLVLDNLEAEPRLMFSTGNGTLAIPS